MLINIIGKKIILKIAKVTRRWRWRDADGDATLTRRWRWRDADATVTVTWRWRDGDGDVTLTRRWRWRDATLTLTRRDGDADATRRWRWRRQIIARTVVNFRSKESLSSFKFQIFIELFNKFTEIDFNFIPICLVIYIRSWK